MISSGRIFKAFSTISHVWDPGKTPSLPLRRPQESEQRQQPLNAVMAHTGHAGCLGLGEGVTTAQIKVKQTADNKKSQINRRKGDKWRWKKVINHTWWFIPSNLVLTISHSAPRTDSFYEGWLLACACILVLFRAVFWYVIRSNYTGLIYCGWFSNSSIIESLILLLIT